MENFVMGELARQLTWSETAAAPYHAAVPSQPLYIFRTNGGFNRILAPTPPGERCCQFRLIKVLRLP
jgi:hypothetical protein